MTTPPLTWQQVIAGALRATADALDGRQTVVQAHSVPAGISASGVTVTGLTALVNVVGPIVRIVEGKGNLADDEAAANAVMDAIAMFVPKSRPIVELIELAEPVFGWIVSTAKSGGFHIQGGIPPSFPPGGGPGPFRGR